MFKSGVSGMSYEEIPATVVLKNSENAGSVVAEDFRKGWG